MQSSQYDPDEAFWQSSDASANRVNAFDDSVVSIATLNTYLLLVTKA